MADIYLYVPCNGTRYYTSPNVASSTFAIYGADSLPSKKVDGKVCTYYDDRALIISNNTNSRLSWNYTVEWWQRNSAATSAAAAMMLSAGVDNTKLQLQDRMSGTSLSFTFENRFGAMGQDTSLSSNISNFNNDEWTHFAYVLDYSNARAYYFKNGVYVTGKTVVTPSIQPSEMYMLCVGGKSSSLSSAEEFFKGYLSDVVVYSGVKYQENETFTPPTESPSTTGLIAYGQESYTYIPKVQLFYENNQYKIYKFGKGGKALPAPTSIIRVFDIDGNILSSVEGGNLDRVDKKQWYLQAFATSPNDAYITSGSRTSFAISKLNESGVAYVDYSSILRSNGSIAKYGISGSTVSKSLDTSTMSGAPTFKSMAYYAFNLLGVGTDDVLYSITNSNISVYGPTNISWDKVFGCTYTYGTQGGSIIASDTSKNLYLLDVSNSSYGSATYLMSYTTNYISSWGYIGTSANHIGLLIADGKLYLVTNSGTPTLLDDTQVWVDCTAMSYGGLAITSDGKLYTVSSSYFGQYVFSQFGSDTGWTKIGGGYDAFPAIKNGDVYLMIYTSGSPGVWTSTQLTHTGRYVDVAGGFRNMSSQNNGLALAQELVPSI